ncbi:hypothetical protein CYMTET_26003 [Cymbomonas tetramitiformis]|uniref:PHD-type domain-containing protein n=1 Tax=Cymbomonas tetramitiformis TaxID=36881 RepID=A0AAE0FSL8_9CHLO|nr:hypothetical protein CYMTET_26003 [Cymbomonas tetramitiformis]
MTSEDPEWNFGELSHLAGISAQVVRESIVDSERRKLIVREWPVPVYYLQGEKGDSRADIASDTEEDFLRSLRSHESDTCQDDNILNARAHLRNVLQIWIASKWPAASDDCETASNDIAESSAQMIEEILERTLQARAAEARLTKVAPAARRGRKVDPEEGVLHSALHPLSQEELSVARFRKLQQMRRGLEAERLPEDNNRPDRPDPADVDSSEGTPQVESGHGQLGKPRPRSTGLQVAARLADTTSEARPGWMAMMPDTDWRAAVAAAEARLPPEQPTGSGGCRPHARCMACVQDQKDLHHCRVAMKHLARPFHGSAWRVPVSRMERNKSNRRTKLYSELGEVRTTWKRRRAEDVAARCSICEVGSDGLPVILCGTCFQKFHETCLSETELQRLSECTPWLCPLCQQSRMLASPTCEDHSTALHHSSAHPPYSDFS